MARLSCRRARVSTMSRRAKSKLFASDVGCRTGSITGLAPHDMAMTGVYLDWNATAPLRPRGARGRWWPRSTLAGNPSSVHAEGRAARRLVEEARGEVAALVGAEPRNVVFTSGGTEANTLALTPRWRHGAGPPVDRLLVSAIEHPSVLAGGRFRGRARSSALPVDADGRDRSRRACAALSATGRRPLVSRHARQQRDRRHPADRARSPRSSTRPVACCMSTPSRRRAHRLSISMRSAPIC